MFEFSIDNVKFEKRHIEALLIVFVLGLIIGVILWVWVMKMI